LIFHALLKRLDGICRFRGQCARLGCFAVARKNAPIGRSLDAWRGASLQTTILKGFWGGSFRSFDPAKAKFPPSISRELLLVDDLTALPG